MCYSSLKDFNHLYTTTLTTYVIVQTIKYISIVEVVYIASHTTCTFCVLLETYVHFQLRICGIKILLIQNNVCIVCIAFTSFLKKTLHIVFT